MPVLFGWPVMDRSVVRQAVAVAGHVNDLTVADQAVQATPVQNLVIHIQTVIEEITLNEFDGVFDFALAFRICTPAEVDLHPAVLTELLKFVDVDDIAAVLADTDDAVLVKHYLSGHTAPVAETVMAGICQIHRSERAALALCIFRSEMRKQECGHINLCPSPIYILEGGLTKVHLHLLSHGKLSYSLIASGIRMSGKMIFLPEFFYIPGDRSLGMIFLVMFFQPVVDPCCRKRRIFPEPGNDLVPVGIQISDADDLPGIMLVLLHIHVLIPFHGLAVDTQNRYNDTLESLPPASDEPCCTRYNPSFRHGLSSGIQPLYQRKSLILSGILRSEGGPVLMAKGGKLLMAEIGILYFTIYKCLQDKKS